MEKIENVTCIKFEDKIKNQHQEPFLLGEAIQYSLYLNVSPTEPL